MVFESSFPEFFSVLTVVLVSCDLLIRLTLWKFDNVSKLNDLEEEELADETEETPGNRFEPVMF